MQVARRFGEVQSEDSNMDQALRKLVLLQQAMRGIPITMARRQQYDVAQTNEDRLGWATTFLRAAEDDRLAAMKNVRWHTRTWRD